jgi:RHS repeat-associated protein
MKFPSQFNFNLHEGLDIGLYYVHGRWYNPDTGLFLSPDANGSYIYYDNDPINKPHRLNAPFIQTGLPQIVNPSCRQTLPGVHPVVNYICDEMVTNASGQYVRQMRQLNTRCLACAWEGVPLWYPGVTEARNNALLADAEARATAYALWGWLVRHGGPWDHKSIIREQEKAAGRDPDWQQVGDWKYSFDTWSNIHYGYVGIAAGFSADALLEGAGLEQIGSDILAYRKWPQAATGVSGWRRFDEASDQAGIQIGINLWNAFRLAVKPEDIVRAIQSTPGLNRQPARGGQP